LGDLGTNERDGKAPVLVIGDKVVVIPFPTISVHKQEFEFSDSTEDFWKIFRREPFELNTYPAY
jgi:hypothetical protein